MRPTKSAIFSSLALILAMLACTMPGASTPSDPGLAGTITAQAMTIQAPGEQPPATQESANTPLPPADTATFTPEPTITETPTITLTPTPTIPLVSVSQATNCRTGPGVEYDLISSLSPGQTAEVVGKYTPLNYWIIKTPGGSGTCWLWGAYATVSGNTAALPELIPPPTPTPSLPAAPKNFTGTVSCTLVNTPFVRNRVFINLTWTDVATNEEGYRIYRGGTLVATLGANANSYNEQTSLPAFWIIGNPPPSVTYKIEAFNSAGNSPQKEATFQCP